MPWMYVPAYNVFILAAGSVAAGGKQDAWILTLTGWFLIHGHACFLFFVAAIVGAVLLAVVCRYGPRASLRAFARPRMWVPPAVISGVFALPIVVNLVLHWPGDFGKYFSYSSSASAGGRTASQVVRYVLWYWWKDDPLWVAALVPPLAYWLPSSRWPCRPAVRYAVSWPRCSPSTRCRRRRWRATSRSESTILPSPTSDTSTSRRRSLLVIALAVVHAPPVPRGAVLAVGAAVLGAAAFAAAPGTAVNTSQTEAALPHAVSVVAGRAHGRMIVVHFDHNAWQDVTGFLVQAERTGVRACVANPYWTFMMSRQFICTPAQIAAGAPFWFYSPVAPHKATVIARLQNSEVTAVATR
jgi:hypothetical protein